MASMREPAGFFASHPDAHLDSRFDGVPIGAVDRYSDGGEEYVVWRPPFGDRVTKIRDAILNEVMIEFASDVRKAAVGLAKSPERDPGPPPPAEICPRFLTNGIFHDGAICSYRVVWPARDGTVRARWMRLDAMGSSSECFGRPVRATSADPRASTKASASPLFPKKYSIKLIINGIQEIVASRAGDMDGMEK